MYIYFFKIKFIFRLFLNNIFFLISKANCVHSGKFTQAKRRKKLARNSLAGWLLKTFLESILSEFFLGHKYVNR